MLNLLKQLLFNIIFLIKIHFQHLFIGFLSFSRPEDYFAEMAKTDEHMQKVRKNLLAKQAAQARTEKVRQLRDQKKIAKRVQV